MNKKIQTIKKTFNITQKYVGWGRKSSGQKAIELAKKNNSSFLLLEDGFIRSIGLGDDESFSIIEDDIGIYYDATTPSKLENILNSYKFSKNELNLAKKAINLIKQKKISKYNTGSLKLPKYLQTSTKKVLIIAQTKGDMSLKYGLALKFDEKEMLKDAIKENPNSEIYLKVHPDVLAGKKESSIDLDFAKKHCKIIAENIHPIVLLEAFDKVYTQTSQMGFEALLLEKEVITYGIPFYSNWGLTIDKLKCDRRKRKLSFLELFAGAYILYTRYYNPYLQKQSNIIDTINTIDKYRNIYFQNSGKLYFFGFTRWKRKQTKKFFTSLNQNKIHFCNSLNDALKKGLDKNSKIFIWGMKKFDEVENWAKQNQVNINRIEDGFIRSVSLGSDLTKAYSLVVDTKGIYFNPKKESDLEYILQNYKFDEDLLKRAKNLRKYLIEKKLSKYNIHKDKKLTFKTNKKIILVIGQVEDDASIKYGGNSMTNLELLKKVHQKRQNEYIIYKPHPDVEAGNRVGKIDKEIVLKYANEFITDISLPSLLEASDEVHTITSLSGFEALIREKKVFTYGMPFYAGWGLTIDEKQCHRRKRKITINELVAATYILYPRYINPKTDKFCEVEILINEIENLKKRYNNDKIYRLLINTRNFISRKVQFLIKVILGE